MVTNDEIMRKLDLILQKIEQLESIKADSITINDLAELRVHLEGSATLGNITIENSDGSITIKTKQLNKLGSE